MTYPSDLDEYAKTVEGAHIPEGMVEVYGQGSPDGDECLVAETLYLNVPAAVP